ncbi:MAG: hypothetical protein AAB091_03180 [Elusimicrobiota bacterium]
MNRQLLEKAQEALSQIELLAVGGWSPAESIARQLRWCIAFASDQPREERPGPFSMGLIATRELDMHGNRPELAALINQVQRDVESALAQ